MPQKQVFEISTLRLVTKLVLIFFVIIQKLNKTLASAWLGTAQLQVVILFVTMLQLSLKKCLQVPCIANYLTHTSAVIVVL